MTKRSTLVGVLVALMSVASMSVHAGNIVGLDIPGVPGESVDRDFKDMIDVASISVAVTDRICAGFTVMKNFDLSSPVLSAAALSGVTYPVMTLYVKKTGEGQRPYLTYALANATVHTVSTAYDSTGNIVERVVFRPTHLTLAYKPQDEKGGLGSEIQSTLACKYK